jgi:DNA-binding NtrC family response regulator
MILVVANSKQEKCRLLIIEDDTALAALLEEYLSGSNYDVQVINDGSSAIELLSRQHFDVVLSDVMLPGVDGMTILKKVGGDFARTIVVLMTGYSGIDDALSAVKQGAYDFVSKPFQLPEIRIRLDNAAGYQKLLRQMQGEGRSDHTAEQTAVKIYSSLKASYR